MALYERVERGRRADQIKSDPVFVGIVEEAKDAAFRAFLSAPEEDAVALRKARSQWDGLDLIVSGLQRAIDDGKVAAAEIEQKEGKA